MALDPKILARLRTKPPEDDGRVEKENLFLSGENPLPADRHPGCAPLTGAWKQRKWAIDLRNGALSLKWSDEVYDKLCAITDATWWIANKSIVHTMKYKEPSPQQMLSGGNLTARASGRQQSEPDCSSVPPPASAAPVSRTNDAAEFAASVSKHPKKAEAAILALLSRLYKGPMKESLQGKAMTAVIDAQFEDGRDLDAIKKLLA